MQRSNTNYFGRKFKTNASVRQDYEGGHAGCRDTMDDVKTLCGPAGVYTCLTFRECKPGDIVDPIIDGVLCDWLTLLTVFAMRGEAIMLMLPPWTLCAYCCDRPPAARSTELKFLWPLADCGAGECTGKQSESGSDALHVSITARGPMSDLEN
mmetsp:Transcript_66999/g.187080  ORF Transcript_66999/g.187080 Transcript_66999/m.187080 type:complete len:153 (+) Transcript_66999:39-497(+)